MSNKSKRRRELERQVQAVADAKKNTTTCIDRSAHWQAILIFGHCGKCGRQLVPFGV